MILDKLVLDGIQNYKYNQEYLDVLYSILGEFSFLVDDFVTDKENFGFLNYEVLNKMNKFATLEDIVNLKWQFNWMVLEKCWNYHVPVYIRNNELKYTNYGIVYKKCMSDYEYDIFKRYLINDTNMALINSIYNAEGSIFSNKHKKVLCKYCNISDELDFSNYSLIDVNEEDKVNTRIKELKTIYKRIDK